MKLRELRPQFFRYEVKREPGKYLRPGIDPARGNWTDADFVTEERDVTYLVSVDSLAEADAITFLCPKCFAEKGGPAGTHTIVCNRPKVPLDPARYVGPGRWEFHGTGYDDLTLVAGSSSILLLGGCAAHFFIQQGEIR